jgi:hypothetical protein
MIDSDMQDPVSHRRSAPTRSDAQVTSPEASLEELKESLRRLLATVLENAFGLALEKVEGLARSLEGIAARGGPKLGGLLGGAQAVLTGANPVWGAVKGAVAAMSPGAKAALITVLVLAILLLPVTVILVLVGLIIAAVAVAVAAGTAR